ncbi:MAG: hypothetical protein KAW09_00570 [Thermoplasmata archaeon]|nr:hypothetical protein [Thermoplasmata archaeon]
MAEGKISRLMMVLFGIAILFVIIGLYVFTINRFIGIGIIVMAIIIFLMPMTRPRY